MQWSGPNIQLQLCHSNKNEKKLNYLVKPHERCQYGISFYMNGFLPEKSNLQHCQNIQNTILTVLSYFSRSLVVFFFTKIFQNVLYYKLSVGFRFLWFEVSIFIKKRFYFNQFQPSTSLLFAGLALLFAIGDLARYLKKEQSNM